jgi:hypothetical protein
MAAPSLNELADKYADKSVGSYFIYTHEAHPGEEYLHLTSMEQKTRHAEALRDIYGVTRPILLDSLDGACHRAFGGMPNMSWIFDRVGRPFYKGDWTDGESIAQALVHFLNSAEKRRNKQPMAPFLVERLDFRVNDQEGFYRGLERNGPKAVQEFRDAFRR